MRPSAEEVVGPGLRAAWELVGRARWDRLPDHLVAFRAQLGSALRAGHGLGVTFDILVAAAVEPTVRLGCSDASSARWVARVLLPCYGRTVWRRHLPQPFEDVPVSQEWGHRVGAWPERFREPGASTSVADDLTVAMWGMPTGVVVRWHLSPCPPTWKRRVDVYVPPATVRTAGYRAERGPVVHGGQLAEGTAPGGTPLFWRATATIHYPSSVAERLELVRRSRSVVEAAIRSTGGNGIRFTPRRWPLGSKEPWFALSVEELALVLPSSEYGGGAPAESNVPIAPLLPLGRTSVGRVVGPTIESDQGRHLAVLGETGMGKSSTLVAVAQRACALGGVVLFDPLGDTARSFRQGLSVQERSRLLWIAPQEEGVGINALEGIGGGDTDPVLADRRLNDLVHALRRVRSGRYESNYWGPRLEEMLTRALSAAAGLPDGTLDEAHGLLANGGRGRQVVPFESRETVRELSDRVRERPDDAEGARRLLYEVVRSPVLRRMLCERTPRRHASEVVSPGRIAIVSGDASTVGESVARYLLAIYLALVWSELLARPSDPKTFVILDESQWFSHDSLAEMLQLARRHNVHVALATQAVGSLPETVADAVWTNVSDFVAFRGSPAEARELARATSAVSVEELLALPRGHALVMLGKGNSVEWVRTAGRRPHLVRMPWGITGTGAATSDGSSVPAPADESSPATVEEVLSWIRERARGQADGAAVRVELSELRHQVDPSGETIRETGARLGRCGALVRSSKDGRGPVWVVDPARIPRGSNGR